MQTLKNTIIVMSAVLFALGVALFSFFYLFGKNQEAMLQRIDRLEQQVSALQSDARKVASAPVAVERVVVGPQAAAPTPPTPAAAPLTVRPPSEVGVAIVQRFAAMVRSDPPRALEGLRAAVQKLDREEKPGSRYVIDEALRMLERTADPHLVDSELRGYFENNTSSAYLRASAAGHLAKRGDDSFVHTFLDEAAQGPLRSPDLATRLEAVVNIASTESPVATPYLLKMLNDPEFIVRARATEGLGIVGGVEAAAALVPLQNDPSPAVRDAAQRATEHMQSVAFLRNLQN